MNDTVDKARDLRKNQTEAEKLLWSKLRARQFHDLKFRRQHPIPPYIADFYCDELKLVVELDGGQHNEDVDAERQRLIEEQGITILRFWNNDVFNNIEGILKTLETFISSSPSPNPLLEEEGSTKRIVVGKIAQAHGVKGLVKILPLCEDPALLEAAAELPITLKNPHGKYYLAEIEGVYSREDVEAIKGTDLTVSRDQLPEPEEGEYYVEDLVGMKAINANSGKDAGIIIAVYNFGAGDLLEIKPKSGETYLLPFNDDQVPEITDDFVSVVPLPDM